jgi:hypothetical protein
VEYFGQSLLPLGLSRAKSNPICGAKGNNRNLELLTASSAQLTILNE